MVDRPCPEVRLGHPERFFDVPELVVAPDDEVRGDGGAVGAGGRVGAVALQPGQVPCPGLKFAVHALDRAVEGDEPVPLDRGQAGDGLGRLGDLLIDPPQAGGAPSPPPYSTATFQSSQPMSRPIWSRIDWTRRSACVVVVNPPRLGLGVCASPAAIRLRRRPGRWLLTAGRCPVALYGDRSKRRCRRS
jgi:hypothetical protein